jgi:hypothetical protein
MFHERMIQRNASHDAAPGTQGDTRELGTLLASVDVGA